MLATREDPGLGLHRLRLAGALTESAAPTCASPWRRPASCSRRAGSRCPTEGSARLWERTEGWAAGLRLAAISLAGHPDPERFVAEFSGSERTVAGYLLAEVLERQPPDVRDLLLRTSVLERVNGPLADALTGRVGSEAILQDLEDANAFVVVARRRAVWFRYHHLLADLLQLELRRRSPAIIDSLHRAAAAWFEAHGDAVEAIRHAQSAGDWRARRPPAGRQLRRPRLRRPQGDAARAAGRLPGRRVRARTPSWRSRSPPARLYDGLLEESATDIAVAERLEPRRCRRRGGGCSTCGWPARGSGSRASAATSPPRGQAMRSFDARTEDELGAQPTTTARRP